MQTLFRQQALDYQRDRLHGDILLLPKFSHALVLFALMVWVLAVIIWLFSSTYARKQTVIGWLEPAEGVIRISSKSQGIIKNVLISEGDHVTEGQPLAVINGDRSLADGSHLEALLLQELEDQRNRITGQMGRAKSSHQKRMGSIKQQISAAQEDLSLLDQQMNTINNRYTLVSDQVARYRKLKEKGHISSEDFDRTLSHQLEIRSDREALSRSRINQTNHIQQLQTELLLLPDEHANTRDQLGIQLGDINQQITQLQERREGVIKASRSGIISNLQARSGQQVRDGTPLLYILPSEASLQAKLLVPVQSIGFVESGQSLDIRYDAFPYQKFGLYSGEVMQISDTVFLPNDLVESAVQIREPVYRVSVKLISENVQAYGKAVPLKPGMTFSADINLGDRTLIQWLLEPIYSLQGRL